LGQSQSAACADRPTRVSPMVARKVPFLLTCIGLGSPSPLRRDRCYDFCMGAYDLVPHILKLDIPRVLDIDSHAHRANIERTLGPLSSTRVLISADDPCHQLQATHHPVAVSTADPLADLGVHLVVGGSDDLSLRSRPPVG
jgi:hypothetical protein